MQPLGIKNKKSGEHTTVPCGSCPECIARRQSAWSFRLMQEERVSTSAFFVTLTYDTDHVPISQNGFMCLDKKHVQLFFKRLRKAHPSTTRLKYYLVGEYGTNKFRPHYHVILFNAELSELIGEKYAAAYKRGDILLDGKGNFNCSHWIYGHVTVGHVTPASVGYCLVYMNKTRRIPMHRNDDRIPEFGLMSKRLGLDYLTEDVMLWHKEDVTERMYVTLEDGKKCSMPRYYKDKLYTEQERLLIAESFKEKYVDRVAEEMRQQWEAPTQAKFDKADKTARNKREAVQAAKRIYKLKNQKHGTL